MELFKSSVSMARIHFLRWLRDIRVWFLFFVTIWIVKEQLDPVLACGLAEQQKANICMLPMLFQASGGTLGAPKIILHMGMVALLCDAPFFHPMTSCMISRSGRRSWCLGSCLYILGAAFLYLLFISLVSSALMLPIATFSNDEWGHAVDYFLYGDVSRNTNEFSSLYGNMVVPEYTIKYVYPYAAQLYTFLTAWVSFSFLGLLMYAISLYQKTWVWSISAATVFVFLEPILNVFSEGRTYWLQLFSPLCWNSIDYLNIFKPVYRLSIPRVSILCILTLVLMLLWIWRRSLRTMIQ